MPGITGIIRTVGHPENLMDVDLMVQRMCHEPSIQSEHVGFVGLGVSAGWVTRSGSFAHGAPFWNEDRTVGLIFAGEDFAAAERIGDLQRHGHTGLAEGAGLLVHLYEELGPGFLADLNGWFSGLLIDLREEKVILFNDRYGLGRIYYHESSEGFFFASEAKSLLAVLPRLRTLDPRSLAEFFSVGCVLQGRSLFKGIALLPGASQWTFHRDGRIDRQRYFNPDTWEQQEPLDARSYAQQLEAVFSRVAPRYLRGPSPVAMSLTGGLDSRMVLAWAGAPPGSLPCYTFGGPYRDCHDLRIARRLAAVAGQAHTTIPIREDFFPAFAELAEQTVYLSDGTMDVSGAVELYANRLAREIAPVRLTGNYGSEILRSNVAFRPGRLDHSIFTSEFGALLDEAADTYRAEAVGHRLSFIAFKQVPWHHYGRFSVEQSQLIPRSPFLDNELVALAYRAPADLASSPVPLLELIAAGNSDLDRVPTDRRLSRRRTSWTGQVARAWQEFTAKAEYAFDYGMPQRLVKSDHFLSAIHLERLFLGRHKFYHFRIWYKQELKGYLEAFAADSPEFPSCYREGAARRLIKDHVSGRGNHTSDLHKLLSVHLIQQRLIGRS